ncbi:EamA family transporter [Mucilaginibacter conchicola]|uniref:EamA family transporter n=1 Tax=Mucilaginibacter conchicola TaxID=2303333 RepID=A0A372NTR2_9SPHI|nr:EamA family transporter [Mucilaginibacter conchicola]RFZ92636.1 EamA family transporter [Mucilaginibacter conchicola]
MKQAYLKLHIALVLAGFTGIFGKLITLNAALISWYRLFFSAIIMLLFFAFKGKLPATTTASKLKISFTGLLLGIHWILFYGSIKYSNVSVGVVCFALSSFFNAILGPVINKRKLSIQELLLSSLTLLGIGLIFGMDAGYRTGIILGVFSSICSALYTLYSERIVKDYDSPTFMLWQMSGGFAGLTLLMPLVLWITPVKSLIPSTPDLLWLVVLAAFCTVLLYFLINASLKQISSFTVSLTFNLEPLYTILLAVAIFKEGREFTAGFYCGLVLIISSLIFQMYRVRRLAITT